MFDSTGRTTDEDWKLLSDLFKKDITSFRISVQMSYTQAHILHNCLLNKYDEIEETGYVHLIMNHFIFSQIQQLYYKNADFEYLLKIIPKGN